MVLINQAYTAGAAAVFGSFVTHDKPSSPVTHDETFHLQPSFSCPWPPIHPRQGLRNSGVSRCHGHPSGMSAKTSLHCFTRPPLSDAGFDYSKRCQQQLV